MINDIMEKLIMGCYVEEYIKEVKIIGEDLWIIKDLKKKKDELELKNKELNKILVVDNEGKKIYR